MARCASDPRLAICVFLEFPREGHVVAWMQIEPFTRKEIYVSCVAFISLIAKCVLDL